MSKTLRGDYSRESLEKIYKECDEPNFKERFLAIKMVYSGKKVTEVAKDLSLSHKTVYNWIDKWNEKGIEGLKSKKRGKPRAAYLKREDWLQVIEEIKDKGYNLEQIREYIQKTRGISYSYKGVWAILRQKLKVPYGKPYVLNGKPSPTASEDLKKTK
jgi:transposase